MTPGEASGPPGTSHSWLHRLLAEDGWACLAAFLATVGLELGLYWGLQAAGVPPRPAMLSGLAAAAVWIALSAGAFAAGSPSGWGALCRGGTVADSSAVFLIVLWVTRPEIGFLAALDVYCIYAAMALAAIAAVRCGRSQAARNALAVAAATVLLAAMASPFWVCGWLDIDPVRTPALSAAVHANGLYGIWAVDGINFIWHESDFLYRVSSIRNFSPPAPIWYAPAAIYAAVATVLALVGLLRHRQARPARTGGPVQG